MHNLHSDNYHFAGPIRPARYYASAEKFYKTKLLSNPEMPRYNHLMAAITSERGHIEEANNYYRQAIESQPGNIMMRNDYAVHLARSERVDDALHEFKKSTLISEDNATIQKNLAAVLGNSGRFEQALEAGTRARFANPYDAMNHRNLAKIHAALGDARSSLDHNLMSIQLENPRSSMSSSATATPNTQAFRAAAVQIIAKGGHRDEAHALMDAARQYEHKKYECSTSVQTHELIMKIKKRHSQTLAQIEKEQQEILNKQKIYDYDNKDNVLSEIRQMKLTKSIKS
jgi:tetratricopeptide (TPR) repeat protein